MSQSPVLEERVVGGVGILTDPRADELGVRIAFTTRDGGISEGPWRELNLSVSVGDERGHVAENRRRAAAALSVSPARLRFARQVHGADVVECGEATGDPEGDVLVARTPGVVPGVLTADCVPVLIAGERGVAAVHAGWRGLVAGAVQRGVATVGPVRAAWVGPSIHACCYEVGAEVIAAFEGAGFPVADASHVDPGLAAVAALRAAGVENVASSHDCTGCDERFFSHRRDGVTGRQGSFIELLDNT